MLAARRGQANRGSGVWAASASCSPCSPGSSSSAIGTAAPINQDGVNLVTSALIIVAVAVSLVRRRLTHRRAMAFAGVLILCALFSYRDFISDPLGSLLGFSGAALVLFGLSWDLLTDSGWGNRESRRFPRRNAGDVGVDQLCADHDRAGVRGVDPGRQHHDLLWSPSPSSAI